MRRTGALISSGGRITALIAATSVAVSAIVGYFNYIKHDPSPHINYRISNTSILIPSTADTASILKLLEREKIASASTIAEIVNIGTAQSSSINIQIETPGPIYSITSEPNAATLPPWVSLEIPSTFAPEQRRVNCKILNLAPGRPVHLTVGYAQGAFSSMAPKWDIVADGKIVSETGREENSYPPRDSSSWDFVITILPMIVGMVVSWLLGRRVQRGSKKYQTWNRFREDVSWEISLLPGVKLIAAREGRYGSTDPDDFWDLRVLYHGELITAAIHSSSQNWEGITGTDCEQREFLLQLLSMANKANSVPCVIYDREFASTKNGEAFVKHVEMLAESTLEGKIWLFSGTPVEIAKALSECDGITARKRQIVAETSV